MHSCRLALLYHPLCEVELRSFMDAFMIHINNYLELLLWWILIVLKLVEEKNLTSLDCSEDNVYTNIGWMHGMAWHGKEGTEFRIGF